MAGTCGCDQKGCYKRLLTRLPSPSTRPAPPSPRGEALQTCSTGSSSSQAQRPGLGSWRGGRALSPGRLSPLQQPKTSRDRARGQWEEAALLGTMLKAGREAKLSWFESQLHPRTIYTAQSKTMKASVLQFSQLQNRDNSYLIHRIFVSIMGINTKCLFNPKFGIEAALCKHLILLLLNNNLFHKTHAIHSLTAFLWSTFYVEDITFGAGSMRTS